MLSLCTFREKDLQILVIHLLLFPLVLHDSWLMGYDYIILYCHLWLRLYSWISWCSLEHPFLILLYYINYAIVLASGLLYFSLKHEQTLALVLWEMVFNAKQDLFLNPKFSLSKWYLVNSVYPHNISNNLLNYALIN
jgi:hypothetical protein